MPREKKTITKHPNCPEKTALTFGNVCLFFINYNAGMSVENIQDLMLPRRDRKTIFSNGTKRTKKNINITINKLMDNNKQNCP